MILCKIDECGSDMPLLFSHKGVLKGKHDMQEKADADAAAAEGTSQMWVAQKYIEQPLVINRR